MKAVPFAAPDIGEEEIAAVTDVLRSGWLTTGERCREFEAAFADAVGATHAVAVNSCTAALHLSLEALGVGDGDLVFMSPFTFAASAEVVRYLQATPVFVDIDPITLNVDTTALRHAVIERMDGSKGRPRVIMPIHIAGLPCDMDAIWALARETDLAVVEDAAHAFPASIGGRPVGSVPPDVAGAACFSFYATKTITTGEGGMITTESDHISDRARTMSLHGLSHQAWSRYSEGGSSVYDILAPGFKYNLTDIAAALGLVQLRRAKQMWERRGQIARRYTQALDGIDGLECPREAVDAQTAWHLYVLRVDANRIGMTRDNFAAAVAAEGIATSVHFIPLHLHSYYRKTYGYLPGDFPIATREFERAVSLPIYSSMSDEQLERVTSTIRGIVSSPRR